MNKSVSIRQIANGYIVITNDGAAAPRPAPEQYVSEADLASFLAAFFAPTPEA